MQKIVLACLSFMFLTGLILSQGIGSGSVNPDLLTREWHAKWIAVPDEPAEQYGVYLFRKKIDLEAAPEKFVVHVSADNRYKLYVNGRLASAGPARGDLFYWNYETVDLASFLCAGENIIAAVVWNEGTYRPEAQISWRTGFILQGNSPAEESLDTGPAWKCIRDDGYRPLEASGLYGYYVAGPGERIDMKKHIRGWREAGFNDASWKNAALAHWRGGSPKGIRDASGWMLVPSSIPQMERTVERLESVREATGIEPPGAFPASAVLVGIPARTKAALLLDNGHLTNAYVTLQFSRGRDAVVSMKYAEALYEPAAEGKTGVAGKGNRNEVIGKIFLGREDRLISDGTERQEFNSLYWRTYRYILLTVETGDEPLVIEDLYGTFTGYPFRMNAAFHSDDATLDMVLEIGWRTARLCAIETYMDCPYYEQLQYIGDARIQALVSLYNSGDERLVRNALDQMDHSRIAEGLTLSRHPSVSPQIIPSFSLWYIGMLHDYWMYGHDSGFVREKLPGTRAILDFFRRYRQPDGRLRNVPYWNFTDWVTNPGWLVGTAPLGADGGSSVLDLQLLLAYRTAAELESSLGMEAYAQIYTDIAGRLAQTIRDRYWDGNKGLFADTAEKRAFSQHANSLAILAGMVPPGNPSKRLAEKLLADRSLAPASIYFKYYLHRALIRAGLGDRYLTWLDKWHENIAMGMTTWAEDYDVNTARSDCHAWGASPNIELYRTVLGIDSGAPGFAEARIEPHPGTLKKAAGRIPHPQGDIVVDYELKDGKWSVRIDLPGTLTGSLIWKDRTYPLKAGRNVLTGVGPI